ncbi:Uncharacterized conserved protein YdaU, DUF1376 family [Sphingomonas sp. NFR04]|uniref:DUF1376 domain-containing protein n=1 Tax=Sphingomonas sp. NFR04 TaxID=1566283 RepID=UPI0008E7A7DC|nr:DUF1376 domain-containing protein [Sphingomonas sp. NFR04]SFK44140.1 Uncharacterized conserved protein YdaU, DUF1376 family [Sphingomonas sp. NFR04]
MAEFPALPLWTDAYLADTRHLSTLEHGAYLLLLMEAWRRPSCSLPDNDVMLARLAGVSDEQWAGIRDIIMSFWKLDGRSKTWTQKRLLEQRDFSRKRSESQRGKAVKRWNKKEKEDATAVPEACPADASISISISSVSKDTGAEAPPDPVKELFDTGVALLTGTGTPPTKARSVIGKWRKEQGDAQTLAAIVAARDHGVSSPVEWITARFRKVGDEEDEAAAIRRATIERYRRMGMVDVPARH